MKITLPNNIVADRDLDKNEIIREDGVRVEKICKHGVGHPVGAIGKWENWMDIHGCDGCCAGW